MSYRSPFGPLPSHWTVARLRDLTSKIGSGATPRGGEKTYLPKRHRYALVRSQCVHDRHFDTSSVSFISDEQAHSLRNAELRSGDILINITGDGVTFARSSIVPDSVLPACVNQHVSIVRPRQALVSAQYLMSFLASPEVKPYIEGFNAGGSRRAITKGHIESFEIPLPPLIEQEVIGSILGSLDDKIELNRRMNETLEAMAQAIFRDWFVDFGPTRRKLEGASDPVAIMGGLVRDADRARALADLFPATLREDGLPEGWAEEAIGELVDIVGGSTPSTAIPEFWEEGRHPWATPKDLSRLDSLFLAETERCISDAGLAKISSGLSPAGTVLLSSRAPIGYLAVADVPVAVNQGFIAIRPSSRMGTAHILLWCRENMDLIKAHANGSTFMEISKKNFRPLPVVRGGNAVSVSFEQQVSPLLALIKTRNAENRTLAATRDLLLPKLMSGEVRLGEAQDRAREVA